MEKRGRNSLPPKLKKYPLLMFSHGIDRQRQTFYSTTEDHYYIRVIPELRDKRVVSGSNGWLILEDINSQECYFLLKIASMVMIELPRIKAVPLSHRTFIVRSAPNDPNCKLLLVAQNFFLLWQQGDKEFVRKDFCIEGAADGRDEEGWLAMDNVIIHHEKIYVMTRPPSLDFFVADLSQEQQIISFTKVTNNKVPVRSMIGDPCSLPYLISWGDEILLVLMTYASKFERHGVPTKFEIFRFHRRKDVWVKVKDIDKQVIFLWHKEARLYSASYSSRIKENSIYFVSDLILYVFDLGDESLSASLPCPNVPKDYKEENCWIWS